MEGRGIGSGRQVDADLTRRFCVCGYRQHHHGRALGAGAEVERRRFDRNHFTAVIGSDEIQPDGRTMIHDPERDGHPGSRFDCLARRRNHFDDFTVKQARPDALSTSAGFVDGAHEHAKGLSGKRDRAAEFRLTAGL
jgi:hypothetical protein